MRSARLSPEESSAIAVVYTMFLAYVVFRDAKLRDFGKVIKNALKTLAIVMTLLATAKAFAYMMTELRIPAMITEVLLSVTSNKYVLMLIINILLLIVGTFMEALAAIVILTPILLPIVTGVGVSPLHFGSIIVVNLAIGFITPPVGVNLFVSSGISGCKLANLSKSVLPMIGLMLLVLLVITSFPHVTNCLVSGH